MEKFQNIGLLTRLQQPVVSDTLNHLADFLSRDGRRVMVEEGAANMIANAPVEVMSRKDMAQAADLVIVVGGDGTMLSAARDMLDYDVPLLGVNRGRLGFLTDIRPDEVEQRVSRVLAGEYVVSDRFLLEMRTTRMVKNGDGIPEETPVGEGLALNDVVLHPGKSIRMMEFELYVDKQFVYSQRSDGLIISTPTGSTAYALSAGGPIMHPKLDAIVLVPMNAHTLTNRPIVVDGDSAIEIRVGHRNELHPQVTCDGQRDITTEPCDVIRIHKYDKRLRLIHPVDHNFYGICRSKLGWGSRLDSVKQRVISDQLSVISEDSFSVQCSGFRV